METKGKKEAMKFKTLIEKIMQKGDNFVVTDSSGKKILGKHKSKKKALAQLAAVEISKMERKKKNKVDFFQV
jgi:hypothetical protein